MAAALLIKSQDMFDQLKWAFWQDALRLLFARLLKINSLNPWEASVPTQTLAMQVYQLLLQPFHREPWSSCASHCTHLQIACGQSSISFQQQSWQLFPGKVSIWMSFCLLRGLPCLTFASLILASLALPIIVCFRAVGCTVRLPTWASYCPSFRWFL